MQGLSVGKTALTGWKLMRNGQRGPKKTAKFEIVWLDFTNGKEPQNLRDYFAPYRQGTSPLSVRFAKLYSDYAIVPEICRI
ncbi:MAG: nitrate reductase beta subunit [Akkermansiaceae bacterium]